MSLQAEGRCFEAYEHLAVVWRAAEVAEADRPLWRALAQTAAACCHVQRDNVSGARKILARAAGGLEAYAADHAAVDVDAIRAGIARLRADLDAGREPRLPDLVWRGPP